MTHCSHRGLREFGFKDVTGRLADWAQICTGRGDSGVATRADRRMVSMSLALKSPLQDIGHRRVVKAGPELLLDPAGATQLPERGIGR